MQEYFADPKATVKRVVAWLGLPETNEQQLKAMVSSEGRHLHTHASSG